MEVEIHVSGLVEKSLGFKNKIMSVPEDMILDDLVKSLELTINKSWLIVTVNDKVASNRKILFEGDRISILPICGGG